VEAVKEHLSVIPVAAILARKWLTRTLLQIGLRTLLISTSAILLLLYHVEPAREHLTLHAAILAQKRLTRILLQIGLRTLLISTSATLTPLIL
jgi:hypothetical protein